MPQPARKKPTPFFSNSAASEAVQFQAAAKEGDLPKFSMTAYTGGLMRVSGYYYPVVVNLATASVPSTVAILKDHDTAQAVGHAAGSDVTISAQRIKLSGQVSGTGDAAGEVVANAANGFPWQASIGGTPTEVFFIDRGDSETVNGRIVNGPAYRLEGTLVREVSFVVLGADGATSSSVTASFCLEVSAMNFNEWLAAKKIDEATLAPELKSVLQAAFDAEIKAKEEAEKKPKEEEKKEVKGGVKTADQLADEAIELANKKFSANYERIAAITILCEGHPELLAKAVKEKWDATKTELEVLRASRGKPPAVPSGSKSDVEIQVIEASLCIAGGISEDVVGKMFPQDVMNRAVSRDCRGAGLHSLMNQTILAATGHGFHGLNFKSNDFIRAALSADRSIQNRIQAGAGSFSTLSLSNVLENVAHKAMIARYNAQEVTWPIICGIRQHSDFKIHSRYQITGTGAFKKVGPDGELKHIGMTDAKYTNQLETYGAIIALTRQMQFNDDLGAFMEIPAIIGEQSQIRREESVYVLLLSIIGTTFSTANKNRLTGAGSALSIAAVTAARQKMMNKVDSNGKPILISPSILLTGSGGNLADLATDFYIQSEFSVTTTADTPKSPRNPHKGKYKPVQATYLSNTDITDQDGKAITGQTSTGWALLADPNLRTLLAMANLNGNAAPTIERQEAAFDTLGMMWRGYDDFGVGIEDPNGGVWNDGV